MKGTPKHHFINSQTRTSGEHYNFSHKLDIPPNHNRIIVNKFSMYKSYDLVSSGYNTFTLTEGKTDATITISVGDYSSDSFITQLQTQLNSSSPNGWTYTVSYPDISSSPDTGKYTFTVSGNSSSQPSFTFPSDNTGIHELMGFHPGTTNTFSSDSLTSTHKIKFQLEDVLVLRSDLCENEGDNILCIILSSNTDFLGSIVYNASSLELDSRRLKTNRGNSGNFSLTDEYASYIDPNGLNFVIDLITYEASETNIYAGEFMSEMVQLSYNISKSLEKMGTSLEKMDASLEELVNLQKGMDERIRTLEESKNNSTKLK